ncbi:CorA family divalent cation transporter [Lactobacillus sp. YT155]|uniref:CorA family divalent cation transporter n=1 Tax=Lactobacillus sp. YT155 TaxID=3060955 RepID=UPI00265E9F67|nr:CorA family divalent cation transporter [Lactobacillus sp. YT155]MDO1605429.1 CorA family divalent cation transporter [Lactobacillus sp. YT155]
MIMDYKLNEKIELVSVNELSEADTDKLTQDYKVTPEVIEYATDMKERPRIEYIESLDSWLVVFQVVSSSSHINKIVLPITFLISTNRIILFTTDKTLYTEQYFNEMKNNDLSKLSVWGVFFSVVDILSEDFIDRIEEISDKRASIQRRIAKNKISDKEILELSVIQEEISYILTAVNGDYLVAKESQLYAKSSEMKTKISKQDIENINNATIEFEQIQKMVELLGDVTDKLSNSFNNLLNNQTNATMKILTIYSLILSIPTIISGFYGMNMFLPIADKSWSWIFSVVLVLVGVGVILADLKRRHFM